MRRSWLVLFAAMVACDGTTNAPEAPEVVGIGELPVEVDAWIEAGRAGALADGAEIEVMVPAQLADGAWTEEHITFTWNEPEDQVPGAGIVCPYGSTNLGSTSATVSASACSQFAARAAARDAAESEAMLDCFGEGLDYCYPDIGGGIIPNLTSSVISTIPVAGLCGTTPPLSLGWRATATASGVCCAECEPFPF